MDSIDQAMEAFRQQAAACLPKDGFLYHPNPGNAGDALITCATLQIFAETNQHWELMTSVEAARDRVVVLGGGGSFCEFFDYAPCFVKAILPLARELIILPATIAGWESLLAKLDNKVTVFCRERTSFEHVEKHVGSADVRLGHDLVFGLNLDPVRAAPPPSYMQLVFHALRHGRILPPAQRGIPKALPSCWFLAWAKIRERRMLKQYRQHRRTDAVLNAFRTGHDSCPELIGPDNFDVSAAFAYGAGDELHARYSAGRLLGFLESFETIRTNRLHVGILAGMLGKNVEFSANQYFKCKAVYEHSMAEYFPNITWMDD